MRWRRVAVMAGILVAAGGIGAVSWGLLAYNEVTKIDRSSPAVVLSQYLDAALVREDAVGAALYSCEDQDKLTVIHTLRGELDKQEQDGGVSILVTWGPSDVTGQGKSLTHIRELTITERKGVDVQRRYKQRWKFSLMDADGWRVCGAEKVQESTA